MKTLALLFAMLLSSCGIENNLHDPVPSGPVDHPTFFCYTNADAAGDVIIRCKDSASFVVYYWEGPAVYQCGDWYEVLFYRQTPFSFNASHRIRIGHDSYSLNYRGRPFYPCRFW